MVVALDGVMDELRTRHVVLIVDDDEDLRAALSQLLSMAGYRALEASGAKAALELMSDPTTRPCAVLTDVRLNGMSGFELRRQMRDDARLQAIPVLFMTGGAADSDQGLIDRSAMLQKPFGLRTLSAAFEPRFGGPTCRDHGARVSGPLLSRLA